MPFSFNPGQSTTQTPQGGQGIAPPIGSAPAVPASSLPSVPDSPFLFIQQRGREFTINAYLQIILLLVGVISVIAAITIFIYGFYLKASIENKKEELTQKESTFKEYPLKDMKRLSDRAMALDQLLKGYISIRSPLKLLEDVVEKQVVFNNFILTRSKNGNYTASFTVVTGDYQSLIQQLEALKLTQYSKVAPTSKADKFSDDKNLLKVIVNTPVFAQGVLPDDVVFVQPSATPPAPVTSSQNVPVSTTTPQ